MAWTRKHKRYSRPKKPFEKQRIEEENEIIKEYGLKNKREIWKAEAAISRLRRIAKKLITSSQKEQEELFNKLNKIGLKVSSIPEVLALEKRDWIKRRLQSILLGKKLAKTPPHARQLIVHKRVKIKGRIVNQPSYIVRVDEEDMKGVEVNWGVKTVKLKTKMKERIGEVLEAIRLERV